MQWCINFQVCVCFSVFSLLLLHHRPQPLTPSHLKFLYNLSSVFSAAPPVIFEVYETSAHVRVCVSALCLVFLWIRDREKKHRLFSRASRRLYLPNPSSVAKHPPPHVTPSHRHLGNRWQSELPAGIADLSWLQSTSPPQDVCGLVCSISHNNVVANSANGLMWRVQHKKLGFRFSVSV